MEKCMLVPWYCTIIIVGECTFCHSLNMCWWYDYKPIMRELCGFSTLGSVGTFTVSLYWNKLCIVHFPMKTNFKIHESVCISCSRFSLCEVWLCSWYKHDSLDIYVRLFFCFSFHTEHRSMTDAGHPVLLYILSFVWFWRHLYTLSTLWLSYSHFIDDLCRKYVANKSQFFSISCNVEYISCNDDLQEGNLLFMHIGHVHFYLKCKILASIIIYNVLKMNFFLLILIVRISEIDCSQEILICCCIFI